MRFTFLLTISLLSFCFLKAGSSPQIRPEPGWLLPANSKGVGNPDPKNVSNGFFYERMERQVNLTNQTEYLHFIRHITNESGVQDASEVSVTYAPQFQQLIFHKIVVIRKGSVVNQLKVSDIKTADDEDDASNFEYKGKKRAYIILKDIQKGDLIDVSYSLIGFNPVFKGLYSDNYYFYSTTPITHYSLSILTLPGTILHCTQFNLAPAPDTFYVEKYKVYQWNDPVMDSSSSGSYTPSWYSSSPNIEISQYSNWKEVNDWGLSIFNQYVYPLPVKLLEKMAEWRKQSAGESDMFANLALRFVQDQIRYLGLEMGSYTHQPHTPSEVFNRRYGDCKDKSLLLTAILQHEKIEAYIALTNTEQRENLDSTAATPLAFNHAIVAIKRSDGFFFVDPTISLQRGELINSYIPAYGRALVIKPGESALTVVEPGLYYSSYVTEHIKVSFEDTSRLRVNSVYKGGEADYMRDYLSRTSSGELKENYLKYYKKLFSGIQLDSGILYSDDSLKNILEVNESYKIPQIWSEKDSTKKEFDTYAKMIAARFPDPSDEKKGEPLSLNYPCTIQYVLQLEFPQDWPLDANALHIKNDAYQFDFTPIGHGPHQTFTYYFKSFRDYISSDDVGKYKTDYSEIQKCLSIWLSLNNSNTTTPVSQQVQPENKLNWALIWLTFFTGVCLTILFNHLNKKSLPQETGQMNAGDYGGWTVFLGITLIIRILLVTYNIGVSGYYKQMVWIIMGKSGGTLLQALFVAEMLANIFSIGGAVALIYWFYKKRDIFPKMFIYYNSIFIIVQIIFIISYFLLPVKIDMKQVRSVAITELFRSLIYATIWISYVVRSEQIKQTFVNSKM